MDERVALIIKMHDWLFPAGIARLILSIDRAISVDCSAAHSPLVYHRGKKHSVSCTGNLRGSCSKMIAVWAPGSV